jgi:hypothetical protein
MLQRNSTTGSAGRQQGSKEERSFLKKRTKKLSDLCPAATRPGPAQMNKSLFASFSSEKEGAYFFL